MAMTSKMLDQHDRTETSDKALALPQFILMIMTNLYIVVQSTVSERNDPQ